MQWIAVDKSKIGSANLEEDPLSPMETFTMRIKEFVKQEPGPENYGAGGYIVGVIETGFMKGRECQFNIGIDEAYALALRGGILLEAMETLPILIVENAIANKTNEKTQSNKTLFFGLSTHHGHLTFEGDDSSLGEIGKQLYEHWHLERNLANLPEGYQQRPAATRRASKPFAVAPAYQEERGSMANIDSGTISSEKTELERQQDAAAAYWESKGKASATGNSTASGGSQGKHDSDNDDNPEITRPSSIVSAQDAAAAYWESKASKLPIDPAPEVESEAISRQVQVQRINRNRGYER